MSEDRRPDRVTVDIHEGFYFNHRLGLPTVVREYERIETIFRDLQYMACITVQVDQLHKVEYRYGSIVYNSLLTTVTDLLKELKTKAFRGEDIFVVDLFDVDTFVLFLSAPRETRTHLLNHLETIAERLRVGLEEASARLFYPYLKEFFTPTIGYALVIHNPMLSPMRLIMQLVASAKSMGEFLAAKQGYRSKYTLQKIIIEQEIQTVFQPIVDLTSFEVLGYEALSRGPEGTEFTNPQRLFSLAAKSGLSFELDRLCRKKAFERIRHLATDKKIFVNTLTMTIHDPEFRGVYLKELLEDLRIKPENVVFEISETLAIDNYELFREALRDYTDIGIVHADDDLGTGYAHLERIMELSPGYMKVDLSFVRGIEQSFIKQEIMRAMLNLAKGIGSMVIAEGVETPEELDKLRRMGVRYGQGYLFARPSEQLPVVNAVL
ncbi:MAG: EAL domain-containing protein [Thermodesulfobacteriota bacterium]